MPNDDINNDDIKYEGRTYLYIRDHPLDNGAEPLQAGLASWISPDISVIKPDGTRGSEAVAEQVNQVEVSVNNTGGIDAVNAFVEAFFANSATAWTPATAIPIGGDYLTIPGYSRQAISFLWTPPISYTGHGCLLARVSLIIPTDTYVNPNVFDVVGDRHVAQRNIEVITVSASGLVPPLPFNIVNPTEDAVEVQVSVQEISDPQELAYLRISLGCDFAQFGETPLPFIGLDVADGGNPQSSLQVSLKPGEVRPAKLYVERNPNTRSGDLHAVQIVQVDEQGRLHGGLTVVVRH